MSPSGLLSAIFALGLATAPTGHAMLSGGGDAATAAASDPLASIRHLPESNPYRAVLAAWLSLPAADRGAITGWANRDPADISAPATLSAEQKTHARQIAAALRDAASAPPTTTADWPLAYDPKDPDNPIAAFIPTTGSSRELARVATKVADESAPDEAIALYAATAKFGRESRQSDTLIGQLVGVATEGAALAGVARRIGEFSPAQLEALSSAWQNLPAPIGAEHSIVTERNLFFRHFIDKELLPGTKAYFAAAEPALDTLPSDADGDADAAIARLRLSALVDFGGDDKQITLENRDTGESFTVTRQRPAEGVELLGFDIPGQRATIRVHGREAVINLQTKEIVARSDALKRFQGFLKNFRFQGEAEGQAGAMPMDITRQAWLDRIKNHPGGPEAYFADALVRYDEYTARQLAAADRAEYTEPSANEPDSSFDPVLAAIVPSFANFARNLHASDTRALMLQAAIRHRLGQTNQAPADPWSAASPDGAASPFVFTATPDGGFTLASRYQRRKDEPVTYKFAAPDAGVRPLPPAFPPAPPPPKPAAPAR